MNENRTLLAIDPGKAGGMACRQNGNKIWQLGASSLTEGDIIEQFASIIAQEEGKDRPVAILEDLVKFAGPKLPGSTMAVYGASHGFLKGALMAFGFEVRIVGARTWQREIGLVRNKNTDKPAWKRKLRQRAQELYPRFRVTLQTADALLMLEWGRKHL